MTKSPPPKHPRDTKPPPATNTPTTAEEPPALFNDTLTSHNPAAPPTQKPKPWTPTTIFLDLNVAFTSTWGDPLQRTSMGRYITEREQYREWLADLITQSGIDCRILTHRHERWKEKTLERIEATTSLRPTDLLFRRSSDGRVTPHAYKTNRLMELFESDDNLTPETSLAIESNGATRHYLSKLNIKCLDAVRSGRWFDIPYSRAHATWSHPAKGKVDTGWFEKFVTDPTKPK